MSEILIFLFVFNDYVLMDIGILPDQTKFPMHCKQDHALITLITTKMLRFGVVINLRRRRLKTELRKKCLSAYIDCNCPVSFEETQQQHLASSHRQGCRGCQGQC